MLNRAAVAVSLMLNLASCGGPTPPDGYERSFVARATYSLIYDDVGVPPSSFTQTYELSIREDGEDRYTALVGPCMVTMEVFGVPPSGEVQLSPVPFPITCSYDTTDGSTVDVEFTMVDLNWNESSFDGYLDGTFVIRAAGREDLTGTMTVFVEAD